MCLYSCGILLNIVADFGASAFLQVYNIGVHFITTASSHRSESLTCLMACWTLSRLTSLASLSSVLSSIFNIDTLYWHSSTTTTSGCTARIVWVRERERDRAVVKYDKRLRENNRAWERDKRRLTVREEIKTKTNQCGKKKVKLWQKRNANIITVQLIITSRCYSTALLHIHWLTPLFRWQFTA